MSNTAHVYVPPHATDMNVLPSEVATYLDGADLLDKSQAVRVSTVDVAGWPHASLLSAGDMLVVGPQIVRFLVFPGSGTTANLERDGRVTVTLALDGGMWELRLRATRIPNSDPEVPLALFEAVLESVRRHVAPYADVTSGITFVPHDPRSVLARWERQIVAMSAAR